MICSSAMHRLSIKKTLTYGVVVVILIVVVNHWLCRDGAFIMVPRETVRYSYDSSNRAYPYYQSMPLIFIGGMPRSGTTLMRVMLDAHPEVRCGEETRVIPRVLGLKNQWQHSEKESKRLLEAGLSDGVLSSAIAAFILEVIAKHAEPAPRLCNKDPFTLKYTLELARMFPSAKFLLMIRDGRAVVHSIISRSVTISGFDLRNFRSCLEKWNSAMENMYYLCMKAGSSRCLPVYYEQLVLHPEEVMRKVLGFLDIPWDDVILHHEELINKPGGISLSRIERSTDQVVKPVNLDALSKWINAVPDDVRRDIRKIAPMLEKLGYDPDAYPPNYGQADKFVQDNTLEIKKNEAFWQKKALEIQKMTKSAYFGSNLNRSSEMAVPRDHQLRMSYSNTTSSS